MPSVKLRAETSGPILYLGCTGGSVPSTCDLRWIAARKAMYLRVRRTVVLPVSHRLLRLRHHCDTPFLYLLAAIDDAIVARLQSLNVSNEIVRLNHGRRRIHGSIMGVVRTPGHSLPHLLEVLVVNICFFQHPGLNAIPEAADRLAKQPFLYEPFPRVAEFSVAIADKPFGLFEVTITFQGLLGLRTTI